MKIRNKYELRDKKTVTTTYVYRIKVQGELPESFSERLQGMSITFLPSEEDGPVTALEGPLRDQAALAGVLNTLYERRLTVLSLERVKKTVGMTYK